MNELDLKIEPTIEQLCLMCHLSSECGDCCKKCNNPCNSGQICQIGTKENADRWSAYINIIKEIELYKKLYKQFKKLKP